VREVVPTANIEHDASGVLLLARDPVPAQGTPFRKDWRRQPTRVRPTIGLAQKGT